MIHPVNKRRFQWIGILGVLLVTVYTLPSILPEARGGEGKARFAVQFNGTGRLDKIDKDYIVIDDRLIRFSPLARFYKGTRTTTTRSSFGVGANVGYVINSKGEIISLWLLR